MESAKTIRQNNINGEMQIIPGIKLLKISDKTIAAIIKKTFPKRKHDGKKCTAFKEFLCLK